jgi:hypothetical protein
MLLFVRCVTMGNAMPQISRTALVPYSAEQMYQLVNDVQSYPDLFRDAPVAAFWSLARRR